MKEKWFKYGVFGLLFSYLLTITMTMMLSESFEPTGLFYMVFPPSTFAYLFKLDWPSGSKYIVIYSYILPDIFYFGLGILIGYIYERTHQ